RHPCAHYTTPSIDGEPGTSISLAALGSNEADPRIAGSERKATLMQQVLVNLAGIGAWRNEGACRSSRRRGTVEVFAHPGEKDPLPVLRRHVYREPRVRRIEID